MEIELSIAVILRDSEAVAAAMVRTATALAEMLEAPQTGMSGVAFEIVTLDEGSRDNTLSVLSILHAQIAQIRTFQDLEPGTGIQRAARVCRGKVWVLLDRPVDLEIARWATKEVMCGRRASIVPGEILAVERGFGQATLGWLDGGLVAAQREVRAAMRRRGESVAFSPAPDRGLTERARLFFRGRLPRFAAAFDRPALP